MADVPPIPKSLSLTIVTRERKILETEVEEVVLPGYDGELGILPGHTPLLAMLRVGQLRFRAAGNDERLVISWGFAEVLPDRVIVMAERGFLPAEIDPARAEDQRRQAEREMADLSSHDPEFAIVEGKLEESIAMISIHR